MAAACAAGLPRLRVDNALDTWIPDRAAIGQFQSYLVIGWERGSADAVAVGAALRDLPSVALCIDEPSVRLLGRTMGVTAEDFVAGRGGDYAGAFIFRREGASDDAFLQEVRGRLAKLGSAFAIAGPASYHVTLNHYSQARLGLIMGAIAVLGALMLRWITGQWRAAFSAVGAIALSQAILLGACAWLGVMMDMSLSMVPPLMMSLGLSYAAHRALRRGHVGVLVLCAATTALGVGSFISTPMGSIRTFAIAGVAGIALVWLAVMTLVPPPARPIRGRFLRPVQRACLGLAQRRGRWIIAASGAVLAGACIALPFLRMQLDSLRLFPEDEPMVRDFRTLDQRLAGMMPLQITSPDAVDASAVLAATPGIRKVIDVTAMVQGPRRTWWCLADNTALPQLMRHEPQWRRWAQERGTTLELRGVAAQLARAQEVMRSTAAVSLPSMALIAAIAAWTATRRVGLAILAAGVTLLPVAALVLFMAAMGWPLDMPALMIGAITMGVAVDDALHLSSRHARGVSLMRATTSCWRPCIGSSLAASACLGLFAVSPFLPTRQFGLLMAAAILLAGAANHLVLVALLVSTRR